MGSTYSQKEGKVGIVLVLMEKIGEGSGPGHWGRGSRVQVGDNGLGIGVYGRADGQSGKSGSGVELEEGGLEVRAVQEVDGLELDIDTELSTEGERSEYAGDAPIWGRNAHGDLGNSGPDRVSESVDNWLSGERVIRRPGRTGTSGR